MNQKFKLSDELYYMDGEEEVKKSYEEHILTYRMYVLKNTSIVLERLFACDTGDDYWKHCLCALMISDVRSDMNEDDMFTDTDGIGLRQAQIDMIKPYYQKYENVNPPKTINLELSNHLLKRVIKALEITEDELKRNAKSTRKLIADMLRFEMAKWDPLAQDIRKESIEKIEEIGIGQYADTIVAYYTLVLTYMN